MHFDIYKKGQGKYTRLCSSFAVMIIAGLGCYRLYNLMEAASMNEWVETMIPAGIFVIMAGLVFWLINKPSIADFMISAEGEMKKVSWSSRREIALSTTVVITVVVLLAVFIGSVDLGFSLLFNSLFGI